MKRTIEIDDTLQDRTDGAIEEVEQELRRYLDDNPDTDEAPDIGNDLDYSGAIHEIIDGSVPIYTHEIETIWYLHANDLEAAYEDAGIGENPREDSGMVAIYLYIEQAVGQWYYDNAETVFEDWQNAQPDADADPTE